LGLRHGNMWIRDVECPVGVAAIAQAAGEERVAGPIRDHSMAAVAGGGVAGAVLRADLRGHRTRAKQKEGAGRRIAHRAGAAGRASSAAIEGLARSLYPSRSAIKKAPPVGSDDAEERRAASRRCGGFAQGCGWHRSLDEACSDLRSRHQQGSCGRFACALGRIGWKTVRLARLDLAH
jgi:hypothetical protein